MDKERTSFTLSHEARRLLKWLASKSGVSQTAMLEFAIRQMAEEMEAKEDKRRDQARGEKR